MKSINKNKINELIETKETFVIQFSASWCGPCKALTPILSAVCKDNNVSVFKLDIGSDPEYAKELGITSIPYVNFYKEGELTETKIGLAPKDFYERQVSNIAS